MKAAFVSRQQKNFRKLFFPLHACCSRNSNLTVSLSQSYTDPVDGSKSNRQGLVLQFSYPNGDSARVVFRLSGTGSAGATIRMYLEKYEKATDRHDEAAPVVLKSLADHVLGLVQMQNLTGRDSPTVIT
jgi:phosphoglucomutase